MARSSATILLLTVLGLPACRAKDPVQIRVVERQTESIQLYPGRIRQDCRIDIEISNRGDMAIRWISFHIHFQGPNGRNVPSNVVQTRRILARGKERVFTYFPGISCKDIPRALSVRADRCEIGERDCKANIAFQP
jgi:hypothetical protein